MKHIHKFYPISIEDDMKTVMWSSIRNDGTFHYTCLKKKICFACICGKLKYVEVKE